MKPFAGSLRDGSLASVVTGADRGRHPASFRDPHGYVFEADGVLFRIIEAIGESDFRALIDSGLYDELTTDELMVRHEDLGVCGLPDHPDCRVLQPVRVPVISYACEWTFSQLREAALLTLDIQARALQRGLSLRDASTFNVQFQGVRPVFIDTLSFARLPGDGPWIAYRQFCEHFLAPLALLAYHGHSVSELWTANVDGVSLSMASSLLPGSSWLRFGLAMHIHLHAKAVTRESAGTVVPRAGRSMAGYGLRLVDSLRAAVEGLSLLGADRSIWTEYRAANTYSQQDSAAKIDFVRGCVLAAGPSRAIDLGANDGLYAAVLADSGVPVTAIELDALSCEAIFNGRGREWPTLINTARIDLANPTPSFGWAGTERSAFQARYRCDLVLALALVHHLSIARQIPFRSLSQYFAALGEHLIVEYVPVADPMAARLLAARVDNFPAEAYSEQAFLAAFAERFNVLRRSTASSGGRILFWMRRRSDERA